MSFTLKGGTTRFAALAQLHAEGVVLCVVLCMAGHVYIGLYRSVKTSASFIALERSVEVSEDPRSESFNHTNHNVYFPHYDVY